MPKVLCIAGLGSRHPPAAGIRDRSFRRVSFSGASMSMDIGLIICSLVLGYLSWVTMRQQT